MGRYGVSRTTKQFYFFKQSHNYKIVIFKQRYLIIPVQLTTFIPWPERTYELFCFFLSFFVTKIELKKKKKNSTGTCCFKLPSVISFFFLIRCGISRLAKVSNEKNPYHLYSLDQSARTEVKSFVFSFYFFVCQTNIDGNLKEKEKVCMSL